MLPAAISLVICAGLMLIGRMNVAEAVSPDGRRYLALGRGEPVGMPFALRWLLPAVCGDSLRRWRISTLAHLLALPPLLTWWLSPWVADTRLRVAGALLICGLPGVWRIHLRWPVHTDAAAMAWALGSAVAFQRHEPVLGMALALVAGAIKESAPVFAACFSWNLLPLAALAGPLVRALTARVGADPLGQEHVTSHPVTASRVHHLGRWFDARAMIAPWGAGILAPLASSSPVTAMLGVTALLGYAQLVVATDTARLYQWAAPAVILATVTVIPARWAVLVLVLHLFNPWAGTAEV